MNNQKHIIKLHYIERGWVPGKKGDSLHKVIHGDNYRLKFNDRSVRYEVRVYHEEGEIQYSWVRLRTLFYKQATIKNNKIYGWNK